MAMKKNGTHTMDRAGPAQEVSPLPSPAPAIVPLTAADAEAAARLYTRVFLEDEPTSCRHALDPARFLPYARVYVRWLTGKELSFLARDAITGELLGFIFCFDFMDDPGQESPELREFIRHFREAVAMIEELESRHICRETILPGSVLHVFQIGVERKARRAGTARAMIRQALIHAGERGFRQAVADCTGTGSQRVFAQCGFFQKGFASYESFSRDGTCFFSGLEGGITLVVMDLPPVL